MEQQRVQPKKRPRMLVIVGVAAGLLFAVCLCLAVIGALVPDGDDGVVSAPAAVERSIVGAQPTATPPPPTPASTDTPIPAHTLAPTDTPFLPPTIPADVPADAVAAQLTGVTDGDTIDVMIDGQPDTVRLIGIDSPETNSQVGRDASGAHAAILADQTTIYLEPDTTERDQYDRLLRYVYLADGRMVNQEMVQQGFALSVPYPPDTAHQDLFDQAQQAAQAAKAGMWQEYSWAATNANVRSGPGTGFAVVDGLQTGDLVEAVGRTASGDWFKLATGGWVFADLVSNHPNDLAVLDAPTPPVQATATPIPARTNPVAPPPAPAAVCSCSGVDYDCGNFGSWSSAQGCFEYCLQAVGYDVHRLDADNDGVACEALR